MLNSQLGLDAAYDAAIQRAGLLRVQDTHELFSAVETLSHMHPLRGERLMIVSNGAAPAAMALDELLGRNGKLATLSDESLATLSDALPDFIRAGNPSTCAMTPRRSASWRLSKRCSTATTMTRCC